MNSNDKTDMDTRPRDVCADKPFAARAGERQTKIKRNPRATRAAILEAAREMVGQNGEEVLSLSQAAHRASFSRAAAYQHFHTRAKLVEAAAACASAKLYRATFDNLTAAEAQPGELIDIESMIANLADFAMENPALGRVWLFKVLSSRRPENDPVWREYLSRFQLFAQSESAQPGIDVEVAAVLILAGSFIWPVWARASARDAAERKKMAERFRREVLRLSLHGTLKPEKYAGLMNKSA